MRLCSGHFKRGMKLKQIRTEKSITLHNAILFLAQDRELAEEAFAGDIIGLPNHGNLHIGDTITEGESLNFTGLPSFAPEFLQKVRPEDPLLTAVKSLVSSLKELGAVPFVFPAMGSHGGGTVENQTALLAGYGVTEDKVGAEIRATMETVVPVVLDDGTKVHMDKFAYEADGVILINRVKPHTNFRGAIESGIVKMMTIGMGKINGASELHGSYPMSNFGTALPNAAKHLLKKINFLFGVGLVEDAYDHTAIVEAIPSDQLFDKEANLQTMAKKLMGKICFDQIDVLVIDEIGKEISGGGCDPNITGNKNEPGFENPNVSKIVLLDLTDKTKGNATGFAAADVITKKLFDKTSFSFNFHPIRGSSSLITSCFYCSSKLNSTSKK